MKIKGEMAEGSMLNRLEEVEKKLIKNALNKAGGNKSKAAKFLGITRRKLYSMMDRLGGIQGLN